VRFTANAKVTLARDSHVYATGITMAHRIVVLHSRRRLRPGRYTLTVRAHHRRRRFVIRLG
jgi:hypothetical protein